MSEQEMERFTCDDARAVFVRWEKLRILYNLIVGGVGLTALAFCTLALTDMFAKPGNASALIKPLIGALIYGLAANVCYFLGPIIESYARWLGLRAPHITQALFIAGTAFSVLLTAFLGFVMWAVVMFTVFD